MHHLMAVFPGLASFTFIPSLESFLARTFSQDRLTLVIKAVPRQLMGLKWKFLQARCPFCELTVSKKQCDFC